MGGLARGVLVSVSTMRATHEDPPTELTANDLVGGYRVEERIGIGGMGTVYRAVHADRGDTVALKLMNADQLAFRSSIDRMMREAAFLGSIEHRGIPRLVETGSFERRPWIAMELIVGTPLASRLSHGAMDPDAVRDLVESVADVLAAAHALGVTHRDLKPDNIFVTPDGRHPVSVIDWGIAHHVCGARYTNLNEAIGTPTYMAPEQARGGHTDGRADVYGLGVLAFRALTGRAPFVGDSAVEILVQHLNRRPPALGPRCPHAPVGLVELVERMLVKDAGERPTAAAVKLAIHRMRRDACEPDYLELEIAHGASFEERTTRPLRVAQ